MPSGKGGGEAKTSSTQKPAAKEGAAALQQVAPGRWAVPGTAEAKEAAPSAPPGKSGGKLFASEKPTPAGPSEGEYKVGGGKEPTERQLHYEKLFQESPTHDQGTVGESRKFFARSYTKTGPGEWTRGEKQKPLTEAESADQDKEFAQRGARSVAARKRLYHAGLIKTTNDLLTVRDSKGQTVKALLVDVADNGNTLILESGFHEKLFVVRAPWAPKPAVLQPQAQPQAPAQQQQPAQQQAPPAKRPGFIQRVGRAVSAAKQAFVAKSHTENLDRNSIGVGERTVMSNDLMRAINRRRTVSAVTLYGAERVEKSKKFPIGTVHVWGGVRYRKIGEGEWDMDKDPSKPHQGWGPLGGKMKPEAQAHLEAKGKGVETLAEHEKRLAKERKEADEDVKAYNSYDKRGKPKGETGYSPEAAKRVHKEFQESPEGKKYAQEESAFRIAHERGGWKPGETDEPKKDVGKHSVGAHSPFDSRAYARLDPAAKKYADELYEQYSTAPKDESKGEEKKGVPKELRPVVKNLSPEMRKDYLTVYSRLQRAYGKGANIEVDWSRKKEEGAQGFTVTVPSAIHGKQEAYGKTPTEAFHKLVKPTQDAIDRSLKSRSEEEKESIGMNSDILRVMKRRNAVESVLSKARKGTLNELTKATPVEEVEERREEREITLSKSATQELDLAGFTIFHGDVLEKAQRPGLVQKKITVNRGGKSFQQTVWVRQGEERTPEEQKEQDAAKKEVEKYWEGSIQRHEPRKTTDSSGKVTERGGEKTGKPEPLSEKEREELRSKYPSAFGKEGESTTWGQKKKDVAAFEAAAQRPGTLEHRAKHSGPEQVKDIIPRVMANVGEGREKPKSGLSEKFKAGILRDLEAGVQKDVRALAEKIAKETRGFSSEDLYKEMIGPAFAEAKRMFGHNVETESRTTDERSEIIRTLRGSAMMRARYEADKIKREGLAEDKSRASTKD